MDFGILQKYPNVRKISEKVADFAMLCRPLTFFGAFIGGVCLDIFFSKMAFGSWGLFHVIIIGLIMGFFQGGGQALNQSLIEEVEIDKVNGKDYRPTVSGRMSLNEAKLWSIVMFSVAIGISFILGLWTGLFSILMVFFAAAYTMPPFRIKRYFVLSNAWQGIARGFLPAVYVSLMYPDLLGLAVAFGAFFSVWVSSAQTTKDFGDVRGDQRFGINTLPVVIGWKLSVVTMLCLFVGSFVILNTMIIIHVLPFSFLWLNILAIPTGLILVFLVKGMKVNFTENNLAWVFFYITLASFYMVPALVV